MMKIKKSKIIIIIMLLLIFALSVMPTKIFATTEINKVEFSMRDYYNAGDKPEASADGYGETKDYYDVEYEYWVEKDTTKMWYSDESRNENQDENRKLTTFEDGKTYFYNIRLKAKEGYTFADNVEVYANDEKVALRTLSNDKKEMIMLAIKTITPTVYQEKYIEEVEINNATISFKAGDKPVFTGKVSDEAPYTLRDESWKRDEDNKEHHLGSMWNGNNKDKLFNTFESGKTYTYGIYFVSYDYKGYFFTRDTKLKINGKYYNYHESEWESQPNVNKFSTMWITTDLTMIPTESSQENPSTPSNPEKPAQEPVTPTTPTTPTQETEKEPQVTENKAEQKESETNNPKTGDSIILYVAIAGVSLAGLVTMIVVQKRKNK